jgi:hypothetical protein
MNCVVNNANTWLQLGHRGNSVCNASALLHIAIQTALLLMQQKLVLCRAHIHAVRRGGQSVQNRCNMRNLEMV